MIPNLWDTLYLQIYAWRKAYYYIVYGLNEDRPGPFCRGYGKHRRITDISTKLRKSVLHKKLMEGSSCGLI
jgi:hypothetical protein